MFPVSPWQTMHQAGGKELPKQEGVSQNDTLLSIRLVEARPGTSDLSKDSAQGQYFRPHVHTATSTFTFGEASLQTGL